MHTTNIASLALIFVGLCFANAFLMYRLWRYRIDNKARKYSSLQPLILLHRIIGYFYCEIYVYMMFQMVPRLWSYQIELPARTVVHLTFGVLIGIILIIKISIVRFFKPLTLQMAPILGTTLLIGTTPPVSLSAPISLFTVKQWSKLELKNEYFNNWCLGFNR